MENFTTIEECKQFLINAVKDEEIDEALLKMDGFKEATFEDYEEIYDQVNWFPKLNEKLKEIALSNLKKKKSESYVNQPHSC